MTIINVNSISGINSITAQGASGIEFYDSSGNSVQTVTGDGLTVGTGATISGSTNIITASTNSEERLRITADGRIGIGTIEPSSFVEITNSAPVIALRDTDDGSRAKVRYNRNPGGTSAALIFECDTDDINNGAGVQSISFRIGGASASDEVVGIDTSNLSIANGNLVLSTAGTGIDFHNYGTGTNITSNLLDDYEEGTWTPTLNGAFTIGAYDIQTGYYTKIGRTVHVFGRVRITAANLSSPTATTIGVEGLPFTVFNSSDHYPTGRGYGNLTAKAENAFLIAFPNQTTVYFYEYTTDGYNSISGNGVGSAATFDYLFSITYQS